MVDPLVSAKHLEGCCEVVRAIGFRLKGLGHPDEAETHECRLGILRYHRDGRYGAALWELIDDLKVFRFKGLDVLAATDPDTALSEAVSRLSQYQESELAKLALKVREGK